MKSTVLSMNFTTNYFTTNFLSQSKLQSREEYGIFDEIFRLSNCLLRTILLRTILLQTILLRTISLRTFYFRVNCKHLKSTALSMNFTICRIAPRRWRQRLVVRSRKWKPVQLIWHQLLQIVITMKHCGLMSMFWFMKHDYYNDIRTFWKPVQLI